MLFINSQRVDNDTCGGYLVLYFTGGSLSHTPRELTCRDLRMMSGHLRRFVACLDDIIEPFFSAVASHSDLAKMLEDDQQLDYYRGLLLLQEGHRQRAEEEFASYLQRISADGSIDDAQVDRMRREIGERLTSGC